MLFLFALQLHGQLDPLQNLKAVVELNKIVPKKKDIDNRDREKAIPKEAAKAIFIIGQKPIDAC